MAPPGRKGGRLLLPLAVGLPLAAVFALLGWALARTGGQPAGVVINTVFGEVPVAQRPAPEFTLPLLNGDTLRLSDLRGKVVVVDFFASWCPPCRREAPILARVAGRFKGQGVEFVGVAVWDDEGEVRRYVREFGLPFPVGLDSRGRIAIEYGIRGIPEKFLIGRDGVLLRKVVGPTPEEKWEALFRDLLSR